MKWYDAIFIIFCLMAGLIIGNLIIQFIGYFKSEQPIPPKTIIAIGDSLTDGTGHEGVQGTYVERLAFQLPDYNVKNEGIGGQNTSQMLLRFESASYTIIWGGVNDIYQGVPIGQTESNLQKMYDLAHFHGGKVVAITISPSGGNVKWSQDKQDKTLELNRWILASDADYKIDAYTLLVGTEPYLKPEYDFDGTHLRSMGYEKLTQEIINIFN